MDSDWMTVAIIPENWTTSSSTEEWDLDQKTEKTQAFMIRACDMAMPRASPCSKKVMPW